MKDGHLNKCKECTKDDVSQNRRENIGYYREYDQKRSKTDGRKKYLSRGSKIWSQLNPKKRWCSTVVNNALRDGRIEKKDHCECCKKTNVRIHGHHDDYDKPLDVRWLCVICHSEWHKQNGPGLNG